MFVPKEPFDHEAFYRQDLKDRFGIDPDETAKKKLDVGLAWAAAVLENPEECAVWASGMPAETILEIEQAFSDPLNGGDNTHDREPLEPIPPHNSDSIALELPILT